MHVLETGNTLMKFNRRTDLIKLTITDQLQYMPFSHLLVFIFTLDVLQGDLLLSSTLFSLFWFGSLHSIDSQRFVGWHSHSLCNSLSRQDLGAPHLTLANTLTHKHTTSCLCLFSPN